MIAFAMKLVDLPWLKTDDDQHVEVEALDRHPGHRTQKAEVKKTRHDAATRHRSLTKGQEDQEDDVERKQGWT